MSGENPVEGRYAHPIFGWTTQTDKKAGGYMPPVFFYWDFLLRKRISGNSQKGVDIYLIMLIIDSVREIQQSTPKGEQK